MGKVKKSKKNETIWGKKIPFLDDASDKYKHGALVGLLHENKS